MRSRMVFSVLIALAAFGPASGAQAAVSSWLSTVGTVGGGFTPGNPDLQFEFATTPRASIYLWLRNDAKLQSAAYNLATSTPGVINFTGVTIYNPDLLIPPFPPGTDIGDRWNLPVGVGTISGNKQTITNFSAVNVDRSGLDPAIRQFDQLYDPVANAALFVKIDFDLIGFGHTNLILSEGNTLIVENGVRPPTTFGTASVSSIIIEGCAIDGICVGGNGHEIFDGDNTPRLLDNTDFGDVTQGSLPTRSFTIENPWSDPLVIGGPPTLTGSFEVVGMFPTVIAPETSAMFTLGFDTSTVGAKTGSISFPTNRPGFDQYNFSLAANVIPEPSTFALTVLAVVGLIGFGRRRS